jgi:soluble lytic murein transglycosylase-like protein
LLLLALQADPSGAIRARMEAALEKQRRSVNRQAGSVHRQQTTAVPGGFYTTAWPDAAAAPDPSLDCDPLSPDEINPVIDWAARKEGLTPDLLREVIRQESASRPCAVSRAGAMGLMQIMPSTARGLQLLQPFDPWQNVAAGSRYLREMLDRYQGDLALALGAYNAGPGAVDKYGAVPPYEETRRYVSNILHRLMASRRTE